MLTYAVTLGSRRLAELLFGPELDALDRVPARRVGEVPLELTSAPGRAALGEVDVLVTGWGVRPLTEADVAAAPRLRAIIHAGGAVAHLVPSSVRRRLSFAVAGIDNSRPVAEYTLAMILLANKQVFRAQRDYRHRRAFIDRELAYGDAGNRGRTVGLVGASRIGRQVIELLSPFELDVIVADPHLDPREAAALGASVVSLDELFARSHVVSLHAPVLPETVEMVGARQLALMRDGATLINTARGALVDQQAMVAELRRGRIEAILDVTEPEVLDADSALYDLPNVLLTPHVAGSMGREIGRMGEHVARELTRMARGEPFAEPEIVR